MLNLKKNKHNKYIEDINISPLIDMVFILLIFFVVTTSFVKLTGIKIDKPAAENVENYKPENIIIVIDKNNTVYINNQKIKSDNLFNKLKQKNMLSKDKSIMILTDKKTESGFLIKIIDICKSAGIKNISIGAEKNGS
jgi:biopolymer transport protein ExbD